MYTRARGQRYTAPRSRQRGLAVVEFTFSFVIVLLTMLVAAEVGRAMFSYAILTQSVRNGARYASASGVTPARVVDLGLVQGNTINLVRTGQIDGSGNPLLKGAAVNVVVSEVNLSGVGTSYVQVVGTWVYAPLFAAGIPSFWGGNSVNFGFTMRAENTMRAI